MLFDGLSQFLFSTIQFKFQFLIFTGKSFVLLLNFRYVRDICFDGLFDCVQRCLKLVSFILKLDALLYRLLQLFLRRYMILSFFRKT